MAKDPKGNTSSTNYKSSTSKPVEKTTKSVKDLTKAYIELNKEAEKFYKTTKEALKATGTGTGDGLLGANVPDPHGSKYKAPGTGGSFGAKAAIAGQIGLAAGKSFYDLMPSTSAAVGQRMEAQYVSSFSGQGITAASVITRSNAMNRGGFTSAASMQGAASTFMSSGYSFNSGTSMNNMPQIGGISALSGQTNEQVAAGVGSINGMSFLRIGIRARGNDGSIRPVNQIANELFRKMYGNRKPNAEQAAAVMRTNSNAYRTIAAVAGGDENLIASLQAAIMAQAKNNGKKLDTSSPSKMMDLMGLAADDPMRANFKLQTSEAGKLEATGGGLVGGYSAAMNTAATVNDGFTKLAQVLGPVTTMFGNLKGFLETIPGAGSSGGVISGIGRDMFSGATGMLQEHLIGKGIEAFKTTKMGGKLTASMNTPLTQPLTGRIGSKFGKYGRLARGGGLAIGGALAGLGVDYLAQQAGADGYSNLDKAGLIAARAGSTALMGAGIGSMFGPVGTAVGALLGTGIGVVQGIQDTASGGGGPDMAGKAAGGGGGSNAGGFINPLPGKRVTTPYGKKGPQWTWKGYHTGSDYAAPTGTKVVAAKSGTVFDDQPGSAFGITVQIRHEDGTQTLYAHLSKKFVANGQRVKAGQVIGLVGRSGIKGDAGPHLHFEVRKGTNNPVNPTSLTGGGGSQGGLGDIISSAFNSVKEFFSGGSSDSSESSGGKMFGGSSMFSESSSLEVGGVGSYTVGALSELLNAGTISTVWGSRKAAGSNAFAKDPAGSHTDVANEYTGKSMIAKKDLIKLIRNNTKLRGKDVGEAYAIAMAESNGRPKAYNPRGKDLSYGMFQINMKGKLGPERIKLFSKYGLHKNEDLFDPIVSAKVADHMSGHGKDWSQWSTYKSSKYNNHLPSMAELQKVLDEINNTTKTIQQPGGSGQGNAGAQVILGNTASGGGGPDNYGGSSNITLNMTVNIGSASTQNINSLAKQIKEALDNQLNLDKIGKY
jgi:murein DD-endopeptidase MepM/ murein hydrolase activator NlpD